MPLQHSHQIEPASLAASPHAVVLDHERRGAQRKPAGVTALIESASLDVALPCLVCDISSSGARLYLHDSAENLLGSRAKIPSHFTLSIRADRVELDCVVVWRKLGLVGVRFLSAARPLTRKRR